MAREICCWLGVSALGAPGCTCGPPRAGDGGWAAWAVRALRPPGESTPSGSIGAGGPVSPGVAAAAGTGGVGCAGDLLGCPGVRIAIAPGGAFAPAGVACAAGRLTGSSPELAPWLAFWSKRPYLRVSFWTLESYSAANFA